MSTEVFLQLHCDACKVGQDLIDGEEGQDETEVLEPRQETIGLCFVLALPSSGDILAVIFCMETKCDDF